LKTARQRFHKPECIGRLKTVVVILVCDKLDLFPHGNAVDTPETAEHPARQCSIGGSRGRRCRQMWALRPWSNVHRAPPTPRPPCVQPVVRDATVLRRRKWKAFENHSIGEQTWS